MALQRLKDAPIPSPRKKAQWKLVEISCISILTKRMLSGERGRSKIFIPFHKGFQRPHRFVKPTPDGSYFVMEVMVWMYERHLADNDIYKVYTSVREILDSFNSMEKYIDNFDVSLYNTYFKVGERT